MKIHDFLPQKIGKMHVATTAQGHKHRNKNETIICTIIQNPINKVHKILREHTMALATLTGYAGYPAN